MNQQNKTFEENMQRLEQIVRAMERGDVALEESLKLFQEGTELVRSCGKLLDDAELQVKKIMAAPDGSPVEEAFDDADFDKFDRVRYPSVVYAGMLEYDGDLHIPSNYLVNPPEIKNTLSELLVSKGLNQYAVSETQKYGHVTYFWNGNKSGKFNEELETYIEVPSDVVPFEQRPWMKCAEITDILIEKIKSGNYDALRVNFPNGDMVGHTGSFIAAKISVEALDVCLARILKAVDEVKGIAIITADHGNADEMYEIVWGLEK